MAEPLLRYAREHVLAWRSDPARQPLFVHGARQVGKTHLIVDTGKNFFGNLIRIDFEHDPGVDQLFACQSPREICELLEVRLNERIKPGSTLLFLDEIQLAPRAAASLGRFAAECPELHVVAAGSLPALAPGTSALAAITRRLDHFYLGPLAFDEYLYAIGQSRLGALLAILHVGEPLPDGTHAELTRLARQFLCTGGMPAVVAARAEGGSLQDCVEAQRAVAAALRDDVARWGGRFDPARVNTVFARMPARVGTRFTYAALVPGARARDLKPVLDALCEARICRRVPYSRCTGVPLDTTASSRQFRVLMLDVGLLAGAMGASPVDLEEPGEILTAAGGTLCRQFVGQHLLPARTPRSQPELHCWGREARTSLAEVDYVLAEGAHVIPVAIRAGKTGTLRALHRFVHERKPPLAIRLHAGPPALDNVAARLPGGHVVTYRLISLPFYLAGQVRRFCREWLATRH